MVEQTSRRSVLKAGAALAGLGVFGIPDWALPALAQGEVVVPFKEFPATFNPVPNPTTRLLDTRTIDGPFTPADRFFTTQHYGHPEVDAAAFRLHVSGLVERPQSLSLDDLKRIGTTDLVAGFECSGNRRPVQGLVGNGKWTGVPLRAVLGRAGVKADARQIVFFGADHGEEEVEFRTQKFKVEQHFGRSLPREMALSPEPFVAWALNGEPLTRHQGAPLRLVVPGWYGVANVKWLAQIHAQADDYLGKFQARWYRTLKGEMIDGEMVWAETAVTRMRLKSVVARVTYDGSRCRILGFALSDGTPIKSVEIRVDEGPWQPATIDASTSGKYSWKLFTYTWTGATPGEHVVVSRATDVNGNVQPTSDALESKMTFLEDNSQFPRTITIAG